MKSTKAAALRLIIMTALWMLVTGFAFFTGESTRAFKDISRKAKAALQNRQWNDALVALEQGKRQFPRSAKIRLALAYLYRQVNLLPQARESALWASKHSSGEEKDLSFRELAWINDRMFLFEDALAALEQIKKPLSVDYSLEARLRTRRGEWALALSAIEKIQEKSSSVDFWKGWILWHLGRPLEGMKLMRDASPEAAQGVFAAELSGIKDPWTLLAQLAQKSLRGLPLTSSERSWAAHVASDETLEQGLSNQDKFSDDDELGGALLQALNTK